MSAARTVPRPVTPLSILAAKVSQIDERLDQLDVYDPTLTEMLQDIHDLAAGLDPYLSRCTTPESPALQALVERTRDQDWPARSEAAGLVLEQEMLSGHIEGQLLRMLVQLVRARRVLEIGMFTGYSALAMAEALPSDGVVVACELDPAVAEVAQQAFLESPSSHKINVRIGPAQDTLTDLGAASEPFDLIFIDADKAGYLGYLDTILAAGLLDPDGVICVDNTLLQGQPYGAGELTANGRAIADFNRAVAADPRVEQVLLPIRDGVTLIRQVTNHPYS